MTTLHPKRQPRNTQVRRHHTWARACTSTDKKHAGDESLPTATPLGGSLQAHRGCLRSTSPRSRRKGESHRVFAPSRLPLPLAESENAIIPAKRSASCNSILKTRSHCIAQATVLSDLEAGKKESKIVTGGKKSPNNPQLCRVLNPIAKTDKKKQQMKEQRTCNSFLGAQWVKLCPPLCFSLI